ncbi:type II toxin-antitoxin system HicB family antitoxin [Devosia sp. LC5]|uniref:type II toxin-antitoxin system HicB family antitoxin n=1 Tax=Devosia sp. LC5 TaxID=1502724 RepID=UPI0009DD4C0D|nr:type II toxin-antitoxin system HicB family antitoxin [Devosia sp. LC5]
MDYPIVVSRLSDEDGGGYLAHFPDLVGCMSDGETPEEAVTNALLAFEEWIAAAQKRGTDIPAPHSATATARTERDELFAAIRAMRAHHDEIDDQLAELERRVIEIEEQVAHSESWRRFGILTETAGRQIAFHRTIVISG